MGIVDLEQAKRELEGGGIVGVPTETVYGLAALIDDSQALKKVFQAKKRPFFDPLIVHLADISQLSLVADDPPPVAFLLAAEFWPGPLTLVLRKNRSVDPTITAGLDTVGVRIPAHPLALSLLKSLRCPFAAPSANQFKRTSPTTAQHVVTEFPEFDLPILDGGECAVGIESTVLDLSESGQMKILRPGMVTLSMLDRFVRGQDLEFEIALEESSASPGSMTEHYMPAIPLVILTRSVSELSPLERENLFTRFGPDAAELVLDTSPQITARTLYGDMRELSQGPAQWMFVHRPPSQTGEEWDAIWNRLKKAAGGVVID